ncbi:hypothetical protein FA95DRAFT_1339991 [Auriscalpium vulgare]|uniref:Uncharacterized protein n=1 Tax=Auriscalpium vulgare TaxID=40419 RepID=A0ACB8RRF9_9AGAM|nr:hypothetical protein FA95DRAFT_1339991 [Auriscalpium vulgare]
MGPSAATSAAAPRRHRQGSPTAIRSSCGERILCDFAVFVCASAARAAICSIATDEHHSTGDASVSRLSRRGARLRYADCSVKCAETEMQPAGTSLPEQFGICNGQLGSLGRQWKERGARWKWCLVHVVSRGSYPASWTTRVRIISPPATPISPSRVHQ